MNICIPTTLHEWQAAEAGNGPLLLVSRNEAGAPMWVSTNGEGEAENFMSLDGAILWALGMIDVRDCESHRSLFDRHGAALPFFNNLRRELNAKADKADTES